MIFLNSIISKMNKFIIQIFHVKLFRSSSYIAILKPIAFLIAIYACNTNIGSNIEFSFLVEKGHYILLNYMGSNSSHFIDFIFFNNITNLFNTFDHLNSCASVCILSRLYKPSISFFCFET